jgi:hypothetical protein
MHSALMRRVNALQGCPTGPDGEAELKPIVDAIEAYTTQKLAVAGRALAAGVTFQTC